MNDADRFRRLFDGIQDGCAVIEVLVDSAGVGIDHRFIAVNRAFETHTGLKDVGGKRGLQVLPTLEPQWSEIYAEIAKSGEPRQFARYAPTIDRWFEVSAFRWGDAGSREVVLHFKDVTAIRAADAELRQARRRLEETLRSGSVAAWTWDVVGNTVVAEPNLAQLFSVSDEEARGGSLSRYLEAIHEDDRARVTRLLETARSSNTNFEFEYRLKTADGVTRNVVARGAPETGEGARLRFNGVVVDISPQRAAEAALSAAEARLRVALDAGRMGTWELDLTTGVMTCSDTCKGNYGRGPNDPFSYEDLASTVHEDDLDDWRNRIKASIAKLEDFEFDYRIRWPDSSIHWVQVRGSCSVGAAGHAIALSGVSLLIDERKRAEESLRAADRQKDEFLATASHELRTPLTAILGWARLLRAGGLDATAAKRGLQTIERNAKAQVRLIEDILDASRVMTGKLHLEIRPVDVPAMVTAAVDAIRPAAEAKGIALTVYVDPHAARIVGDRERLQQVLWNLANNAIKFTPKGGNVAVRVERVGTTVELIVGDTGQGISADFLPHVFDRFRQADGSTTRRHGGLGLGLALVRHLAEAHGGTVRAESDGANAGSTFTVTLPLEAVAKTRGTAALTSSPFLQLEDVPPPSLRGITVLVVDDEEDARDLVATILRASGAEVVVAASAERALEVLAVTPPTVLVTDIGMPGTDGYDLLQRVRTRLGTRGAELPAIALTAYARDEDERRALEAGFQRHIAKPIEPNELLRGVAEVASTSLAHGGAPKSSRAPREPLPYASSLAKLERVLAKSGIHEALRFLNSRTPHRFTGIFQFAEAMTVRNLHLVDFDDPSVARSDDVATVSGYCARLRDGATVFTTEDARRDPRLVEHGARERALSYCGVLLTDAEGRAFGTLCHFDRIPCDVPTLDIPLMESAVPFFMAALREGRA